MLARLSRIFLLLAIVLVPAVASAQDRLELTADGGSGNALDVTIDNPFEFPTKVVNVRLDFLNDDGSRTFYYSQGGWSQDLDAGGSWSGQLRFSDETGAVPPADLALIDYDGFSIAAGIPVAEVVAPAEAALQRNDLDELLEQVAFVKSRVAPVSRAVRFHDGQIDASGVNRSEYFDLERLDGTVEQLESAICEIASQRLIRAGGQSRRETLYRELTTTLETVELRMTCMNSEARLASARMLIASNRPQDALVFSERGDDGNPLPEWRGIYIEAHLALANTAVELNAEMFSTFRPALEALQRVKEIDPENSDLARIERGLIPRIATWVETATERGDMEDVLVIMAMLRPMWAEFEEVNRCSAVVAEKLIDNGIQHARLGEYINARNEFVRGERVLEGIPEWEARREDINHYRALGVLQEARQVADNVADEDAPTIALRRLEEAQGMYDLSDDEENEFLAYIAQAHLNIANRLIEEEAFTGAVHQIEKAEEVGPNGRTDATREAWLAYAEKRHEVGGLFMRGVDIDDARTAMEKAEGIDEDRISALDGKLTMAFYSYRIGIPGIALLFAAFFGIFTLMNKRKAKKFEQMDDLDF